MEKKEKKTLTRAEKTEATKEIVKEILQVKPTRHNELIDEVAKIYEQRHGEEGENANDVRGRVGSVLDIMKKNSDVMSDGGTYALKARLPLPPVEEKGTEEPAPKKRTRAKKTAPKTEETPVVIEEKAPVVEASAPVQEVEPKAEAPAALVVKPKAEVATKEVMDMSFLFGDKAPQRKAEPIKAETKTEAKPKAEEKPAPARVEEKKPSPQPAKAAPAPQKKAEPKKEQKAEPKSTRSRGRGKAPAALTPDEKLRESFLKKLRSLGGDYFEYYSTYLLERYSIRNGRRLESLRVCGGGNDGGIDGEIELTDALGFKETIYIQSKNWDPSKGKEEKWVVGETLLQQFIGACACRQAKDGRLHARGIFITTSYFTPEAKRILEDMGDKIVGYDGSDLYEAAKECAFGLVKKNGEWALDEKLLEGDKAFFHLTL